jgi:thioesterase domain-containing protein
MFQSNLSLPAIFLVHSVSGPILNFVDLAEALQPTNRSVYGLRDSSLVFVHRSIEGMARTYLDYIGSVQPKGPYVLCGYSFGVS